MYRICILAFMAMMTVGCAGQRTVPFIQNNTASSEVKSIVQNNKRIQKDIDKSTTETANQVDQIEQSLQGIDADTKRLDAIREEVETALDQPAVANRLGDVKESINVYVTEAKDAVLRIRAEIERVRRNMAEMILNRGQLKDAQGNVIALEKRIAELEQETERLRAEAIGKFYGYLASLGMLGVGLLIAGGFTMLYNPKLGSMGLTLGFLIIGASTALTWYMEYIAMVGAIIMGVGLIATVGFGIYLFIQFRKTKKSEKSHKKATKDNVKLIEALKEQLSKRELEKIFGTRNTPGVADIIQSDETQDIVRAVKAEIRAIQASLGQSSKSPPAETSTQFLTE